jgi:2-polyprenyl-3-methyl-5-hydroxy-6-metoxy-1,4-benzoquinol methylase
MDAGCKLGIGAYYLSSVARLVIAVDIDQEKIDDGKRNLYGLPTFNLEFYQGDLEGVALPMWREAFDMIVCLETLEHMDRPEMFVGQVKSMLKPEGYFVFSVPQGDRKSPLHKRIFGCEEDVEDLVGLSGLKIQGIWKQWAWSFIGVAKRES